MAIGIMCMLQVLAKMRGRSRVHWWDEVTGWKAFAKA